MSQELLERHLERAVRAGDDGQQRIRGGLPARGRDVALVVDVRVPPCRTTSRPRTCPESPRVLRDHGCSRSPPER